MVKAWWKNEEKLIKKKRHFISCSLSVKKILAIQRPEKTIVNFSLSRAERANLKRTKKVPSNRADLAMYIINTIIAIISFFFTFQNLFNK